MKRLVAFFLATILFSFGATAHAEAATAQKSPEYRYAEITEYNTDLFDAKWQIENLFAEHYRRAVLLSPKNKKELVACIEASSSIARSDKRYDEAMLAWNKRDENNRKINPFYDKSTSFVRFPTIQLQSGKQAIPASVSGNKNLIIYTKPNGTRWNVKKGATVSFKYEFDSSVYKQGNKADPLMSIGYIKDNAMCELGTSKSQTVTKKFDIPVSGEIEFYILNKSNFNRILANGSIHVSAEEKVAEKVPYTPSPEDIWIETIGADLYAGEYYDNEKDIQCIQVTDVKEAQKRIGNTNPYPYWDWKFVYAKYTYVQSQEVIARLMNRNDLGIIYVRWDFPNNRVHTDIDNTSKTTLEQLIKITGMDNVYIIKRPPGYFELPQDT